MTRRDWFYLLGITLLAGALRFYQLGVTPPGPQFDEAFNAIDAGQVLAGNRPMFLPANGGREVLYTYYQAAIGAITGRLDLYALRLASALAGTLTVAAVYVLVRTLFRRHSQTLAVFTALALTVSYWHIHFSHYGIRIILMPLILSGVFGCFWIGCELLARSGKRLEIGRQEDEAAPSPISNLQSPIPQSPNPPISAFLAFIASGVLTGLGVWNNPTGRFVPLVLLAYVLWLLWRYPERRGWRANPLIGLGATGVVAFVVFLPLGLEFLRHPEFFFGHASEVSIFAERVAGDASPWQLLAINVLRVLGMFSFDGDLEWAHGIPDRPVFDWFMAIPFYIGVTIWLWRLLSKAKPQPDPDRDALLLFLAWAVMMLAPSVLSEAAPNYSRTLAAAPPVMLGAGLGLTWLATRLPWRAAWRYALVGALILASGGATIYDYFVRFPAFPEVYYIYDADKVDAVDWMKASADKGFAVYLSPLWSTHATVTFLRDYRIRALDATQALVLPEPGKGAIYAFPSEQRDFADDLAAIWQEPVRTLNDRLGRPLMFYVQVEAEKAASWPAGFAPDQAATAHFDDAPTLIGMRASEDGRSLLLHWQADAGTQRYLTSFVHLLNARGQQLGQADVVPGDGTFPTTIWRAGERVAQHYTPAITDTCSGGEPVHVLAGWYQLDADGARRPRSDTPSDTALAGTWTLPITSLPVGQIQPAAMSSIPLAQSGLALIGHTLSTMVTEPGAPLTIDLFIQGDERHRTIPMTLTLESEPPAMLYTGAVAPGAAWRAGEVICRRLHVRVPTTTPPGDYLLRLTTPEYIQPFARVSVQPSTRIFELPEISQPITATLGGAVRLHGADVTRAGDALTVRLIWQSLTPLTTSEKIFVHLVGPDGALLTQSDALPAGGYGVEQWVEGEVVIDEHALALPPDLPPGDYRLRVGMYDPATGARLTATDSGGERLADNAVELKIGELP
jgi:4-amino-4-deoxy-L-arabinose transferase-like glycosyltransferase